MLSNKLIQLAEEHGGRIAAAAMRQIRRESELSRMAKLRDSKLRDWALDILKSLQSWPWPNNAATGRVAGRGTESPLFLARGEASNMGGGPGV